MSWAYFSPGRDLCLLGVEGGPIGGRDDHTPWGVAFTLCENFPPFREVQHFAPVLLRFAEGERWRLIREHIDPNATGRAAPGASAALDKREDGTRRVHPGAAPYLNQPTTDIAGVPGRPATDDPE